MASDSPTSADSEKSTEEATKTSEEETKSSDAASTSSMGPMPPSDTDFDEAEIAKAEEFKTQGNKFFKGKCRVL